MPFASGWLPDDGKTGDDRRFVVIEWREDRYLFWEFPNDKADQSQKLAGPEPITEADAEAVKELLI